jgi:hypothetical protein
MKDQVKLLIKLLRNHIVHNLEEIKCNSNMIKSVLATPDTEERKATLAELYKKCRDILAENNDFISTQITLSTLLDKYNILLDKEIPTNVKLQVPSSRYKYLSREECLEMTIEKNITFDKDHPFFNDTEFFKEILSHFEKMEDYETCSQLIKTTNEIHTQKN